MSETEIGGRARATITDPAPAGSTGGRVHMPGLDGLRGLLVPIVLTYHLGVAGFGGFLALEGFFVLSGFLITMLLLDRPPRDQRDLGRWWLRRWRRLVPAVVVVVTVTLMVFRSTPGITTDAVSTLTWWRNWAMTSGATTYWSTAPSPLKHAWSLSVEEQFYLVFPLLVLAAVWSARRWRLTPAGILLAVCSALAVVGYGWQVWLGSHTTDLKRVYLGSDTRSASILLGCVVGAIAFRSPWRSEPASRAATGLAVMGLGAIVLLGLTLRIDTRRTYEGGFVLAALAWVAVTAVAARPGPIASVLSVRPLRWMGVRSYGIYLWSWPIQVFIQARWPDIRLPVLAAMTVASAFALASVSYRLIEQPLLHINGWVTTAVVRRAAWTLGTAVVVLAIVTVALTAPRPDPVARSAGRARRAGRSRRCGADARRVPRSDPGRRRRRG